MARRSRRRAGRNPGRTSQPSGRGGGSENPPPPAAGNLGAESEEQGITLLKAAKLAVEFVGVVAGAGSGLAALAFGIGYLATKSHDAMLGLPTTITSYATYVRTGALFFTYSLYDVVLAVVRSAAVPLAAIAVLLLLVVLPAVRRLVAALRPGWPRLSGFLGWEVELRASRRLALAYWGLLAVTLTFLPYHIEPLHPANTNLLFSLPASGAAASAITEALSSPQRSVELHARYGAQLAAVAALAYLVLLLRQWLRKAQAGGDGRGLWLAAADWGARPVLYTAVGALIVTVPAVYGVMGIPIERPCVDVKMEPDSLARARDSIPEVSGLLWSDLSADTLAVVILETGNHRFVQHFLDRSQIRRIETVDCWSRNPLERMRNER